MDEDWRNLGLEGGGGVVVTEGGVTSYIWHTEVRAE